VLYLELRGGGVFERCNLLAKNELLRLKDMLEAGEEFFMERLVLSFEIEHRDRSRRSALGRC
jgi:hypothetical protein